MNFDKSRENWRERLERDHPELLTTLLRQRIESSVRYLESALESRAQRDIASTRDYFSKAVESIKQVNTLTHNSIPDEVERYESMFCQFVIDEDPQYKLFLQKAIQLIKESPDILQTELYPRVALEKQIVGTYLYFAGGSGAIVRQKSGRTYKLSIPQEGQL